MSYNFKNRKQVLHHASEFPVLCPTNNIPVPSIDYSTIKDIQHEEIVEEEVIKRIELPQPPKKIYFYHQDWSNVFSYSTSVFPMSCQP